MLDPFLVHNKGQYAKRLEMIRFKKKLEGHYYMIMTTLRPHIKEIVERPEGSQAKDFYF